MNVHSFADNLNAVTDAVVDNGAAAAELMTTKELERANRIVKAAAKRDTEKKEPGK